MVAQLQLLPDVIVVVPEGKHHRGGDDSNSMDHHNHHHRRRHQEERGTSSDADDRSRSPRKTNMRGNSKLSDKSVDPSTTKTATTCSLSSHSPSRDNGDGRSHQSEEEEGTLIEEVDEAQTELVGKDGDSDNERGTTTTIVKEEKSLKGGLVCQHTMARLLADGSSDEEEIEEEEEEHETSNAYQPNNNDESINVEKESRGELSGEESLRNSVGSSGSAICQQAVDSFRSGLMSQNTLRRLLQEEEAEEAYQPNNDESKKIVNPLEEEEARGKTSGEESLRKNSDDSSGSAACQQAMDQFREGLISRKTLNRTLQKSAEEDIAQVIEAMYSEHRAEGEIRVAKAGLVSRNTAANLRNHLLSSEVDMVGSNQASMGTAARPRRKTSQTESDLETSTSWDEDDCHFQSGNFDKPDSDHEKEDKFDRRFSTGEKRLVQRGLISQHTMKRLSIDADDSIPACERNDDEANPIHEKEDKPKRRISAREMMMLRQGCASRRSIHSVDSNVGGMKRIPSHIHVSFLDDSDSDIAETEEPKTQQTAGSNNETIVAAAKKVVVSEDDDEEQDAGMLFFSNNDLQQTKKLDVLTEGQYFLGISMLVYMYSHLRETCRMGHTRCSMHDVDTHSVQSHYKKGDVTRYLSATKTAGSIIRLVIDELEDADEDDAEHEIVGGESKEYERQQTAQFRKWIDDSRISQMDEETEKMLIHMKRKVARHRWRRAISAVRLSIRISGGKLPKWEHPVVAPGCENCNRFVDMNAVMSETIRKQPKYFKEGSVMNVSRSKVPRTISYLVLNTFS